MRSCERACLGLSQLQSSGRRERSSRRYHAAQIRHGVLTVSKRWKQITFAPRQQPKDDVSRTTGEDVPWHLNHCHDSHGTPRQKMELIEKLAAIITEIIDTNLEKRDIKVYNVVSPDRRPRCIVRTGS